ncbi:HlyC/CorC family transporter [Candidatus Gracilibacteria bacterium]|nr:HlyC/CorC family transporter [Candidatus Gracilibacteria bacterium]
MDPLPIIIFLLLVAALAFFAGTEIPLMSVSQHKLDGWIKQKRWGARTLARLKKQNEKLLVTNLIGTLLVTSGPTLVAEKYITPEVIETFGLSDHLATVIVYTFAFLTILLFGEIASKIIGVRFADSVALKVAHVYQVLVWLFLPVTWLVEFFMRGLGWILGGKIDFHGHNVVTEEEFDAFIDMSHKGGAVEADERRQIKNLLSLGEMTADSVMTPRVNVKFVYLDNTVDEVCDFLMSSSHSRVPVAGETTDDVDFVITFREAFKMQKEGHGNAKLKSLDLEKIMKVPLTQSLDDLFGKFQKSRRHMALVLDEHGGTAGVVTMEDILEEVFGDIKDEKDKEEIYLRKHHGGKIDAVGTVLIDDILEEYDIHAEDFGIPEAYLGEALSYVMMAEKEEFPAMGTEVSFHGSHGRILLRAIEVHDNVIEKIECEKHHH